MPRLGWKANDRETPPLLARILGTVVASFVFRSTFSVTRNAAKALMAQDTPRERLAAPGV